MTRRFILTCLVTCLVVGRASKKKHEAAAADTEHRDGEKAGDRTHAGLILPLHCHQCFDGNQCANN
jgi:hypothetical protein